MALHILANAYDEKLIKKGHRIVEVSSGNTGISFAAIGQALGNPVIIFLPEWMSTERKQIIRSFGAEVIEVTKKEGGFMGGLKRAEQLASKDPDVFLPEQFSNTANVDAHAATTGPEILSQLESGGITPDAFVAGVGTGGTVMGVGRYLRRLLPSVRIYPVEPLESPTLSTGHKNGQHRIQGISDEFIPPIVDLNVLDPVIAVHDGDSILMAQKLASKLGLA